MFDDEIQLKELVQLTDQRKGQCREGYSLSKNNVFRYLVKKWGVHEEFRGNYADDYDALTNVETTTRDHFSVSVILKDEKWRGKPMDRFEACTRPCYMGRKWKSSLFTFRIVCKLTVRALGRTP